MSDFLTTMADSSRLRAAETKSASGVTGLTSRASSAAPPGPLSVSDAGFDLIAEAKLASPADGPLVKADDPKGRVVELATQFEGSFVAAVSVLTEPTRFAGHINHLGAASAALAVPVMRKDFLVDPIQVLEARASGASGVLLIARLTEASLLVEMADDALESGMFVLVEIFDESDLDVASAVFDRDVLVGVNTRDLTTLEVDPDRLATLAPLLPHHLPGVAESGVKTPSDAGNAAELGYRMALVGTGLVTTDAPGETARSLISAGRLVASVDSSP